MEKSSKSSSNGSGAFMGIERNLKVLLLDKDVDFVRKFRNVFSDFDVHVSACVSDFFDTTRDEDPDVIVMDLDLEDSEGLESLQTVREIYPTLPVVLMTKNYNDKLAQEAFNLGIHDFLLKNESHCNTVIRSVKFALMRGSSRTDFVRKRLRSLGELHGKLLDLQQHG